MSWHDEFEVPLKHPVGCNMELGVKSLVSNCAQERLALMNINSSGSESSNKCII